MPKQSTLLGFFGKASGAAPSSTAPAARSSTASNGSATPARQNSTQAAASTSAKDSRGTKASADEPGSSKGKSKETKAKAKASIPDTPPSIGAVGTRSSPRLNKVAKANVTSPPPSSPLVKRKRASETPGDNASTSSSKLTSEPESNRESASPAGSSPIKKSRQAFKPPAILDQKEAAEDEDEDEDVVVPTGQRRVKKRQLNYAESGGSDDDSDASDNFKPASKLKRKGKVAELAAERRKSGGKRAADDDDFEMEDAVSEDDAPISVANSEDDEAVASDTSDSPVRKSSKSKGNSKAAPKPAPAKLPPRTMSTSVSSSSFLTKAELKAEEAKADKKMAEQPFEFLLSPLDKDKNPVGHPDYDPRTLYIPPKAFQKMSPFEKQFWHIKQNHFDTVLFFQKGKFYELYEDDAIIGHREFDLKLTDRVKMRMAGVPESSFELYAAKFLALGYKVGRVDQSETAVAKGMRTGKTSKGGDSGIVNRELRHVLTSGTIVEPSALQDDMNSYCVSIKETLAEGDTVAAATTIGACTLDAATAEFRLAHFEDDATRGRLETLLRSLRIKELLYEKGRLSAPTLRMIRNCMPQSCKITMLKPESEFLSAADAEERLAELFEDAAQIPEAIASMRDNDEAMSALGAMLYYLGSLQLDVDLCSSRNFDIYDLIKNNDCLALDAQSLTHLNVLTNEQGGDEGTLLRLLNRCETAFGKRLFKIWLVSPLTNIEAINARLDAVEDIMKDDEFRKAFSEFARKLPDIERIVPRIFAGKCKPRDLLTVLKALKMLDGRINKLKHAAEEQETKAVQNLLETIPSIRGLVDSVEEMFEVNDDDQSFSPVKGVHAEFDKADKALTKVEDQLDAELDAAAKALKLPRKSIQFKHVGSKDIYQIEVPRKTSVPPNWILISQTKEVHRHYSPKVRELVQELKEARETRLAALRGFSVILFAAFCEHAPTFLKAVKGVAELDCLISLAEASRSMGAPTCRPTFVESTSASIDFEELRHPCIASTLVSSDFIPNDVRLGVGNSEEIMILTGGNMAGKSTTARTAATAVIIAQLGCMVPASRATISPVDRIASRMGANDQIFRNNSTFMVEMLEASRILQESTPRSLVIMDELGRGTSTFDGHAIAYAVLHHLIGRTRCIGFFLTHYTALAFDFDSYPRVANRHMQVVVNDHEVVFTYKLVPGIAESSYGTQVAALAGIPAEICSRAQSVSHGFALDSKTKQAARVQSRISVATLADCEFLFQTAATMAGDDELDVKSNGATVAQQLEVIREQVINLQHGPKSKQAPAVDDDMETDKESSAALPERPSASSQPSSEQDSLLADGPSHARASSPPSSSPPPRDGSSDSGDRGKLQEVLEADQLSWKARAATALAAETLTLAVTPKVPSKRTSSHLSAGSSGQPKVKRQQMVLDFGQKRSVTCGECGMSYDRSAPEDSKMHAWFHARVVDGIVWGGGKEQRRAVAPVAESGDADEVTVLRIKDARGLQALNKLKDVPGAMQSLLEDENEVTVAVYSLTSYHPPSSSSDGSTSSPKAGATPSRASTGSSGGGSSSSSSNQGTAGSARNTKLHEVLSTVNEALGAAALPSDVLGACKLFVARARGRVVGACLAGRVKPGTARPVKQRTSGDKDKDAADPETADEAVFCDEDDVAEGDGTPPKPSVGIHRVWVMPSLRRLGLGQLLLDAALSRTCYGLGAADVLAIHDGSRTRAVAFSQPTRSGRALAERWIRAGTAQAAGAEPRLLVFRED